MKNSGTNISMLGVVGRVARFFLLKHTKTGNNIPNDHKIYQIAIKLPRGSKIFQMTTE
jgi:hypothetical protein